jgi:hypothetical protein
MPKQKCSICSKKRSMHLLFGHMPYSSATPKCKYHLCQDCLLGKLRQDNNQQDRSDCRSHCPNCKHKMVFYSLMGHMARDYFKKERIRILVYSSWDCSTVIFVVVHLSQMFVHSEQYPNKCLAIVISSTVQGKYFECSSNVHPYWWVPITMFVHSDQYLSQCSSILICTDSRKYFQCSSIVISTSTFRAHFLVLLMFVHSNQYGQQEVLPLFVHTDQYLSQCSSIVISTDNR